MLPHQKKLAYKFLHFMAVEKINSRNSFPKLGVSNLNITLDYFSDAQPWFWAKEWVKSEKKASDDIKKSYLFTFDEINANNNLFLFTPTFKKSLLLLPYSVGYKLVSQIIFLNSGSKSINIKPRKIKNIENLLYCNIESNPFWTYRYTFQQEQNYFIFRNTGSSKR